MSKNYKSEEDLKLQIAQRYFPNDKYRVAFGFERIDFVVAPLIDTMPDEADMVAETFLWAEAKDEAAEAKSMFAQLILTIKKVIDKGELPPKYLGVFDVRGITFISFYDMHDVFNRNDMNWKETPSNFSKKTENIVADCLSEKTLYHYEFGQEQDDKELQRFVKENFVIGNTNTAKAQINKNNFAIIFNKWAKEVLPSIKLGDKDWKDLKEKNVIAGDFYLADLLSENNKTLNEKLNIVLQHTYYELKVQLNASERMLYEKIDFSDGGAAHAKFWAKYERPPKPEYHQYILYRRDLLVPQNIRERQGAYFTPQIWVEKSQEYLAKAFGEDWQEEYYVWDCCCGTCNLLFGLTNPRNVWASTLYWQDVNIVHSYIEEGSFNLFKNQVFQFDFLNGDFNDLPQGLKDIINDEQKRRKLIIYINPPYAEATTAKTVTGTGSNKAGVATSIRLKEDFNKIIGNASNEIFALFMAQVYDKFPASNLAQFSKLKIVQGSNFKKFRSFFLAKFLNGFVVRANTFDNVKGHFPIGFTIWNMRIKEEVKEIECDVIDNKGGFEGTKHFYGDLGDGINQWITNGTNDNKEDVIGLLVSSPADFQHQSQLTILSQAQARYCWSITKNNLVKFSIYFSVRQCMDADWLNDRDQFLYPAFETVTVEKESEDLFGTEEETKRVFLYEKDLEFENNCLIFTLFHSQNRICSLEGKNDWIPFTEQEIGLKNAFRSHFMSDYLKARGELSNEAMAVFDAGKALWRYYHEAIKLDRNALLDASLYEIREYFKGRNEKGRMKTKSTDEQFNILDADLRQSLKRLAKKIEPKVYEYGFLQS